MPESAAQTAVAQAADATVGRRSDDRVAVTMSDLRGNSTRQVQIDAKDSATAVQVGLAAVPQAHLLPIPGSLEPPREALITLQSWEGVVIGVDGDHFTARIADSAGETPDEEVEIPTAELSPFDIDLLESGAIFYWSIGYRQRLPQGTRERVSRIRFRRLPAWSRSDLANARARAEKVQEELGWQ